jgi:hypothetical protein
LPTEIFGGHRSSGEASTSTGSTTLLRSYLAQCAAHFEQKEWLPRSYVAGPNIGPAGADAIESARQFSALARSADSRILILSGLFPQDLAPYGWFGYPHSDFSEYVDIWMPPAQFFDPGTMAIERSAGRRTWVAVDRPPYSGSTAIHAPPCHARVLSWQASALGAEALHLGCVNRWPPVEDSPDPEACAVADPNVLIYPGTPFGLEEPVASVRLKELRRSAQDAAYVRLLGEHKLDHVAAAVRQTLVGYAGADAYRTHFADGRRIGWAEDPTVYETARRIMAEELIRMQSGKPPVTEGLEAFARGATWRQFMHSIRTLTIHCDGARARLTGGPTSSRVEVECGLSIVNRTRLPVTGTIRFGELPDGWTSVAGGGPAVSIGPHETRRATLVARTTSLHPPPDGSGLSLPVEFAAENGTVYGGAARVSYVTATSVSQAPRIDGDLSDWPAGAINVASDFRLIAGDAPGDTGDDSVTRPSHRTFSFVQRDREYLYVAINAESDDSVATSASSRKGVRYEDMIPIDEEIVEVLIDPWNAGTRSPGDLFHIVVKRSGADLVEKGVEFDPPCGPREPWPVDLDVATKVSTHRWTVELRIPLDSLRSGAGVERPSVWGFNITRYDATRQEFSTWSGAVGNAYDPLSLGNLLLP